VFPAPPNLLGAGFGPGENFPPPPDPPAVPIFPSGLPLESGAPFPPPADVIVPVSPGKTLGHPGSASEGGEPPIVAVPPTPTVIVVSPHVGISKVEAQPLQNENLIPPAPPPPPPP